MTIYAGLDIETTGIGDDDRITEIGLVLYRDTDRLGEFCRRVNPQREVSLKAAQITGLNWEILKNEPTWEVVGPAVEKILKKADVVVTHNGKDFDIPFIQREQSRIGIHWFPGSAIDTISARWATGEGKVPSLKNLAWALDMTYDELSAHSAIYDAELCLQCYLRGREYGFF